MIINLALFLHSGTLESVLQITFYLIKCIFFGKACLIREEIFNTHDACMWEEEKPRALGRRVAQTRLSVNVWTSIIGNQLLDFTSF